MLRQVIQVGHTMTIMGRVLWRYCCQKYCNWNLIDGISARFFEIGYYWHGSYYKIRIPKPGIRGPSMKKKTIFKITDEEDADITERMLPYLGPQMDFHQIPYCPIDFDLFVMKVWYTDDTLEVFALKDPIVLYPAK